ncbi:MAG: hypothetical protein IJ037_02390 [Clostridia bacterium]|nr:hypothetical protein [Clostridia bacterium]
MKRKNQMIAMILAALMVSASMTSCSSGDETLNTPTGAETSADTTPVETEPETTAIDLLPDASYDGYTFNILSTDPGTLWGWRVSIYAEEENGEPLNDAVFRRNTAIEERYNITIANSAELNNTETSANAKQLAMAGDDMYAIMSYGVKWQLVDALTGCYINLNEIDTIDFAHSWWNTEAGNLLTQHNKLYVGFNEMNTFANEGLYSIYINNDIIAANQLESPYDLVRGGKWTMDAMYNMSAAAARDMDGNAEMSEEDVIGFVAGVGSWNAFLTAADQPHVIIGEDGSYILNHGTDGSIAAAEKIARLINDKNSAAYRNEQGWASDSFKAGKALFFEGCIAEISVMRDVDIGLGVVPAPKFDENQSQYRAMMSNQTMTIAVPKSNKNLETTGVICEALGAYSSESLRETYYEDMLKGKAARDEATIEMLDIIIDSQSIDVGVLNEITWGSIISGYHKSMRASGTDELASYAAQNAKMAKQKITEISEAYAGLE